MQRNILTRPLVLGGLSPTPGGSNAALTRTYFVDKGTAVPLALQTGASTAPFSTLAAAVNRGLVGTGPVTILLVPGDYSAETFPSVALDFDWSFGALDFASFQETNAFVAPRALPTILPAMGFAAGSAASVVQLRSVQTNILNVATGNFVNLTDVNLTVGMNLGSQRPAVKAVRSFFNNGGVGCSIFDGDQCGFWGSQNLVCSGDTIRLSRSYGQTSVTCEGSPGFVYCDLWTRAEMSFAVVTNATVVTDCNVQNITGEGDTAIDSIVLALVTLGLARDLR